MNENIKPIYVEHRFIDDEVVLVVKAQVDPENIKPFWWPCE